MATDQDALQPDDQSVSNRYDVAQITYAQNFEDVRLWKALRDEPERFYVDVGAGHPVENSVTKLFSGRGWRGVNVEPGPNFGLLEIDRAADINIRAAITAQDGVAPFYITQPYPDLSSLHRDTFAAAVDHVDSFDIVEIPTMRLDTLTALHVGDEPVSFLKIDVEGGERDALASVDWSSFRPVAVVVESIAPVSYEDTFGAWEDLVLSAGYAFAHDDGINRFYGRIDRPEVIRRLALPVSAIDGFIAWPLVLVRQEAAESRASLQVTQDHLSTATHALEVTEAERDRAQSELEGVRAAATLELESTRATLQQHQADLQRALRTALDRDRVVKATAVDLARAHEAIRLRHDTGRFLTEELTRWKVAAARSKAKWSFRVGRRFTNRTRRFVPMFGPIAASALKFVRLRRSRPELVRREYAAATVAGGLLRTTLSIHRSGERCARLDPSVSPRVEAAWNDFAASRIAHSKLLNRRELEELRDIARADSGIPLSVHVLAELGEASPTPQPTTSTTLLVDIRAVQYPTHCGTLTHARYVLSEALDALPPGIRAVYLSDPELPLPAPELLARFDDAWDDSLFGEVGAFLQLAPYPQNTRFDYAALLRSPWIAKATVWLDNIPGLNPDAFLTSADQFFGYQLALETVARFDWLLALSHGSADAIASLGVPREKVVITGSRGSLEGGPRTFKPLDLPFDRYVLAVGNGLPHKNLAAAAAGFVRSWARDGGDLGLVVVGNVTAEQATELHEIADRLGLEPHRMVVHRLVPDEAFAQLISAAEAVVVPSFHEGFSIPVVEATQLGTPVVLSDIPAHRELLGVDFWSFDPSDPTTLSRALSAVLADPADALVRQQSRLRATYDADRLRRSVQHVVAELCADLQVAAPLHVRTGVHAGPAPVPSSNGCRVSLSKICQLEDFDDPRLRPYMREVFAHEVARFGEEFPRGREYRKYWEVAMAVMAFDAGGLLDGTRHFLGVGAGNEPTIFHLTRHAASVLATDLYLNDGWEESANSSMLTDPGIHWPMPWAPERLRVRHMNALSLDLEDESFAGVFSSSSIEHFGDRDDVQRAIDEVFRVLEPGGILSVSSEFRLKGDRPGIPGALLFDIDDVYDLFVGDRDWALLEPFDGSISEATLATAISFVDAAADQRAQVARLGGLWTHHITYRRYPHLVLREAGHTFTSFHLALRKAL